MSLLSAVGAGREVLRVIYNPLFYCFVVARVAIFFRVFGGSFFKTLTVRVGHNFSAKLFFHFIGLPPVKNDRSLTRYSTSVAISCHAFSFMPLLL